MAYAAAANLNERSMVEGTSMRCILALAGLPKVFVPCTRQESLVPRLVTPLRRQIRTALVLFSPTRCDITRKLMINALINHPPKSPLAC